MTQTHSAQPGANDLPARRSRRRSAVSYRLVVAAGALIATDLAGGLLSIAAGLNTWSTAWGGAALLAAPIPMMLGQVVLTWLSVRTERRWAAVPAALLAAASAVSIISGFFDGALRNPALSSALFGFQVLLLSVTAVVAVLAGARAAEIVRGEGRR